VTLLGQEPTNVTLAVGQASNVTFLGPDRPRPLAVRRGATTRRPSLTAAPAAIVDAMQRVCTGLMATYAAPPLSSDG
jgi:hypothetical protein